MQKEGNTKKGERGKKKTKKKKKEKKKKEKQLYIQTPFREANKKKHKLPINRAAAAY